QLGGFAPPAAETAGDVERMLALFPALRAPQHPRARLLSRGEQPMLAIPRGLMAPPRLLMVDAPSLGLAPTMTESLSHLLTRLRDDGTTILLVDQMATLALSVADRAYVLQSGTIRHSAAAADVRHDPALVKAYLGEQQLANDV